MPKPSPTTAVCGPLLGLSHVFYLAKEAKLFFLQLGRQEEEGRVTVVVSLSSSLPADTRSDNRIPSFSWFTNIHLVSCRAVGDSPNLCIVKWLREIYRLI